MPQLTGLEHRGDSVVDAEELVILGDRLYQSGFVLREQRDVLDKIADLDNDEIMVTPGFDPVDKDTGYRSQERELSITKL